MECFRLYCGRNIPESKGGGSVSYDEVMRFCATFVGAQYDGFTVIHTVGFWQQEKEPAFIIEIMVHSMDNDTMRRMGQIAQDYKTMFKQDAVMMTHHPVYMHML